MNAKKSALPKGWRKANTSNWTERRALAFEHVATRRQVCWLGKRHGWCWREHGTGWYPTGFATMRLAMREAVRVRSVGASGTETP